MKKVFVQLELGRGYGRDILKGIHDYNNQYSDWEIIFEPAYYLKNKKTKDIIKLVSEIRPDGCILENVENIEDLEKLGIPTIQTSSIYKNIVNTPYLQGNYDADGKMAFDYFSSKGFKNLAFFGVNNVSWSDKRFNSFEKHAKLENIDIHNYYPRKKNKKKGLGHDLKDIMIWLQNLPKPIGILCCNDDFGLILINACSMAGLKTPYEIAILGIDNDELLCDIAHPKLSSIARNHPKAAFKACEILDDLMNGISIKNPIIPTEPLHIVERASTDTIASNDLEVIKALNFIRNNTHLNLTIDDVVQKTNISRRSLYTRFKKVTNRTILEEIQSHKIKKFKELLIKEKLSVKEIAFHLGFDDVSHISRWFAAIEGVTPIKWKNQNR